MMSKQNVPELRFPEFSGEWEEVKFEEIFSERKDKTSNLEKYPLYSLTVEDGVTPKSDRYNREFLVKKEGNYKLVDKGNIVYNPMNVTLGAIDISKYPFTVSVSGYYNVMISSDSYSMYFMTNYLKTHKMINHYKKIATGSLIEKQRVHFSEFKKIKKPLPEIEEQNKIGDFFSKLDRLIELEEKKLELLEEQKKGYMQKIFSRELRFKDENGNDYPDWKKEKIKNIYKKSYGGGTPKTTVLEYWGGDIPWIQSSDLTNGELKTTNVRKQISQEAISNSAAKLIPKHSIAIVTRVGVGKLAYIDFDFATSQDFLSLSRMETDINFSLYALYRILKKESLTLQGTSIKGITKGDLVEKDIYLPLKEEQQKIGGLLAILDQNSSKYENKIEKLKKIKRGLLQKMII